MACLAFVFGSFPTGVVLTRAVTGVDIRRQGSGNIGAANAARAAGFKVGLAVALLDMLKGALPVLAGRWIGLDDAGLAAVGLAAVLGHDFSIFLRFRGGKGVATTLGVMFALAPVPTSLALFTYVAIMLATRYSSLASLSALALLPGFTAAFRQPPATVVLALTLFAISAAKHWENIVRLSRGRESRFTLHGH
jgi:glycerol-3-phosphate acyltransferase PlsY